MHEPWLGALAVVTVTGGCAGPAEEKMDAPDTSSAVVVDFYADGKPTTGCSATLLSDHVAITAAHCAAGADAAIATATDGSGRSATVGNIVSVDYDWSQPAAWNAQHDVALLVLATSLPAASYPAISSSDPRSQDLVLRGRANTGNGKAPTLVSTTPLRAASATAPGRPHAVLVGRGIDDAGGAALLPDGSLGGVVMGQGAQTSAGYVALLDGDVKTMAELLVDAARAAVASASTRPHSTTTGGSGDGKGGENVNGGQSNGGDQTKTPEQTFKDNMTTLQNLMRGVSSLADARSRFEKWLIGSINR